MPEKTLEICQALYDYSLPPEGIDHPYLFNAEKKGLTNYRLLDMSIVSHLGLKYWPDYVIKFISAHDQVIACFNFFCEKVVSVIMRSIEGKDFRIYGLRPIIPYGLGGISLRFGQPLLIVEGIYDRDVVVDVVPNTIALLTSGFSSFVLDIIPTLTNNLVLCLDSDKAGQQGVKKIRWLYEKRGSVLDLKLPSGIKDLGDIGNLLYRKKTVKYQLAMDTIVRNFEALGVLKR